MCIKNVPVKNILLISNNMGKLEISVYYDFLFFQT